MTGRVEGKVAFITGAARGQGRSHAVRLAQEGADIIAVDICQPFADSPAPTGDARGPRGDGRPGQGAGPADRHRRGRRPRLTTRSRRPSTAASSELGRLDIVVANAGIGTVGTRLDRMKEDIWQEMIDVNLSGVWKTVKAGVPHLLAGGRGGSIILTSSVARAEDVPAYRATTSQPNTEWSG